MIVIGLTGSIGMGKSTAANMLRDLGVPVHDSDAAVHELLGPNGTAVAAVAARFPQTYDKKSNAIDRKTMGAAVFGDDGERKALEAILHPLVQQAQADFIRAQGRMGIKMVALDIPLLFETGAEQRVDKVIVVSAPYEIQRQRVLARSGMTEEQFRKRLASQLPDSEKRRRADYVVETGIGLAHTRAELAKIVRELRGWKGPKNDGNSFPAYGR